MNVDRVICFLFVLWVESRQKFGWLVFVGYGIEKDQ